MNTRQLIFVRVFLIIFVLDTNGYRNLLLSVSFHQMRRSCTCNRNSPLLVWWLWLSLQVPVTDSRRFRWWWCSYFLSRSRGPWCTSVHPSVGPPWICRWVLVWWHKWFSWRCLCRQPEEQARDFSRATIGWVLIYLTFRERTLTRMIM